MFLKLKKNDNDYHVRSLCGLKKTALYRLIKTVLNT